MAKEFVCKVIKETQSGFYTIHTIWRDHNFTINVASENGAWTGEMTEDMIEKLSSQLKTTPTGYISDCKDMLTQYHGHPNVTYSVESNSFVWKRVDDEDTGIKIRFGSVPLKPQNIVDTLHAMLDTSINVGSNLKNQLEQALNDKNHIESNLETLWRKLEEQRKIKDDMEDSLMTGFLNLLNSKKRRIQELEKKLDDLKGVDKISKTSKRTNLINRTKKKEVQEIDPYEIDTEEDDHDNIPTPVPSSSYSFLSMKSKSVGITSSAKNITSNKIIELNSSEQTTSKSNSILDSTSLNTSDTSAPEKIPRLSDSSSDISAVTNPFTLIKTGNKIKKLLNILHGDEDSEDSSDIAC